MLDLRMCVDRLCTAKLLGGLASLRLLPQVVDHGIEVFAELIAALIHLPGRVLVRLVVEAEMCQFFNGWHRHVAEPTLEALCRRQSAQPPHLLD